MELSEQSARSVKPAAPSSREAPPRSLAFVSSLKEWGGGEKWLLDAAAAMRGCGHRVTLAVQPDSALAARGRAAGLAVSPVRLGGWLAPHSLLALARAFSASRVDVVCANLDKEIRQARLAAALAGRSVRLVARRGSPDPIKDNWHYRLVYTRGVDRLICNCAALVAPVCDGAPWFDRRKVWVIPNGIDSEQFAAAAAGGDLRTELGLPPGACVAACVGEIGWRKGQEHVLAAAAALRDRFPRAVWLIAGGGDGRDRLMAAAETQGLLAGGRVRFLGFRTDVAVVLAAADLVVLPSRREGFPHTLLEAMALAKPVAASRADGIPELVEHGVTGLLHAVDDQAAFIADVARLFADPDWRRQLGAAGRARARHEFAQQTVMARVEACLTAW